MRFLNHSMKLWAIITFKISFKIISWLITKRGCCYYVYFMSAWSRASKSESGSLGKLVQVPRWSVHWWHTEAWHYSRPPAPLKPSSPSGQIQWLLYKIVLFSLSALEDLISGTISYLLMISLPLLPLILQYSRPSRWLLFVSSSTLTIGIPLCYLLCHPLPVTSTPLPRPAASCMCQFFLQFYLGPGHFVWTQMHVSICWSFLHLNVSPQHLRSNCKQVDSHQFCSFSLLAMSLYLATQHLSSTLPAKS